MILRRLATAIRKQDWFTVLIETLIVVFGVFIGLQVNNWNNERASEAQVQTYVEQILIDLETDMDTGMRGVTFADEIDMMANQLISAAEGRPGADDITDADLVIAVTAAGYAYLPLATSATYEEMISTGALGQIRDVGLKRELSDYYAWTTANRQWNDLVREEQYAYRAAIRGILSREQFAWARANYRVSPDERAPLPDFERAVFIEELQSRPEIVDSLRSMGAVQERLRGNSRQIREEAEKLAELIREQALK